MRNVIFSASLMMALSLSYARIIEHSAFMAITAIGSAATWVTPLQIAHGAISIHFARKRSIIQIMDYACKAVSSSQGSSTNGHALCHRLLAGM